MVSIQCTIGHWMLICGEGALVTIYMIEWKAQGRNYKKFFGEVEQLRTWIDAERERGANFPERMDATAFWFTDGNTLAEFVNNLSSE